MSERKNPILMMPPVKARKNMQKIFEHQEKRHRTTETLEVRECAQGIYFAVDDCEELPNDNADIQRTSIVIPYSEIPALIKALTKVMDSE